MRSYAQQLMARKLLASSGNHTTLARLNESPNSKGFVVDQGSPVHSLTNLGQYRTNLALVQQYQAAAAASSARSPTAAQGQDAASTDTLLSQLPNLAKNYNQYQK